MNNRIPSKLLLALTVSLSPVLAHAITEQQAIDACAQSLVERIEITQGAPLTYSIGDDSSRSSRRIRNVTSFDMFVTNMSNDKTVLKADCVVNRFGRISRLTIVPLMASNKD